MRTLSLSDYRKASAELIEAAIHRPRMYFRTLSELEALLRGHEAAFEQLRVIDRCESFTQHFITWVSQTTGASGAAGWAYALEQIAERSGDDPETLFAEYVRRFLSEWIIEE